VACSYNEIWKAVEERIKVVEVVSDWKEAVILAGKLLQRDNCIEESYIEGMIKTCQELGPYIAIAPGLAIPHARPEEGAQKTCFSILVVRKGVNFGSHNDPVYIVVAFSSPDKKSHLKFLQVLAELFANKGEQIVNSLRKAKNTYEALSILRELL
jgi:PTS system ascorbate-specific IIA component